MNAAGEGNRRVSGLGAHIRSEGQSWVGGALVAALASSALAGMAWRLIDHLPLYDELLHFFAARGIRDYGEPAIADGIYERAELFTRIVAIAITSFGDTLSAARIPPLLAAIGLVVLLTLWVVRRADLVAGAAAAAVLCLLPATLDLAVFLRFYTLHALLVTAASIALYEAIFSARTLLHRGALAGAAGAVLLLALQLQITTLIAVGAVASGIGAALILEHWAVVRGFVLRYPFGTAVGVVLTLSLGGWLLWISGLVAALREVPLWAAYAANRPHYYVLQLGRELPLLWPLAPVAAVAAFTWHRRLTVFCGAAFLAAMLVHSLAGPKSMRYVYYALPWFCVVWGCGASAVYSRARRYRVDMPMLKVHSGAPFVLALAALVMVFSREGQQAARMLMTPRSPEQKLTYGGETDWAPAVPTLEPLIAAADRVVTSNAMKALYYLGRYDYELNASIVLETSTQDEFGIDERTGKQAIGTEQSTRRVLDMPGKTVFVLEDEKLDYAVGVPTDAVRAIAARCMPVAVPSAAGIHTWTCP